MKRKEMNSMAKEERTKKMEELKMEMIKAKAGAAKTGSSKVKTIRKMIARIHTMNRKEELKGGKK